MSYQIKYTDRHSGETRIHTYSGNVAGAKGWAETLSRENNGCRAECVEISSGLYDPGSRGRVTHIITVGDDGKAKR